nr:glycosyltransferase [Treponema sp.]
MKAAAPLISVCIPVFNTEAYLAQCLRSVFQQDFNDFEIVLVSDASEGKDEKGRPVKKIVRMMQKESDKWRKEHKLKTVPIRLIVHKENRGLIEVRRSLMYEARASYMSQVDSDDQMAEGALTALYNMAISKEPEGYDIVHGTSTAGVFDQEGKFIPTKENRYGAIHYGSLEGHEVFFQWLMKNAFTANTWGKLIKRELWQKAYENIPYTECNMADDFLLFFFLGQYAKSYIGIENQVYKYRV